MTTAQILHFLIAIGLGILAFLTFIVAMTILGLMLVEDCYCVQYPIGIYVLGILGILLLASLIMELIEAPLFSADWLTTNRQALILAILILLAIIFVL
jgi:endonuclease/exonuclease/phosphatase (EEP) superfamily protein YafD